MKPTVGTCASVIWLTRGAYASIRTLIENYKKEGRHISSKLFDDNLSSSNETNVQTEDEDNINISSVAKHAANISGYHPKVCQCIIDEFKKIQNEHEQKMASSSRRKRNPISLFSISNRTKRSYSMNRLNTHKD